MTPEQKKIRRDSIERKAEFNRFKSERRAKARAILAHRGGVSLRSIPIPSNSFTDQILAGKI